MGQIKNIKLHIVTDIKVVVHGSTNFQTRWFIAKSGFLTLDHTDLVPASVVCVPTNMESSASTDSVCADSASVNTPTTLDSESSSNNAQRFEMVNDLQFKKLDISKY